MRKRYISVAVILFLLLAQFLSISALAGDASQDSYPKEIEDSLGRKVVIEKPVERIIALGNYRTEAVKVLGAEDMLVGIDGDSIENNHYFPELTDLPQVGTWSEPDIEAIAKLKPDIVITSASETRLKPLGDALGQMGIVVVGLDLYRDNTLKSEVEKLGCLLDKEEEAREYIEWREGYEKTIEDYVSHLTDDQKPKVYLEWSNQAGKSYGNGSSGQTVCDFVGARNIAAELDQYPTLDMEWIISQNPDYIVATINKGTNWGWNSTEEAKTDLEKLTTRTGWSNIVAVKDGHAYVIGSEIAWGLDSIVFEAYCAKWYHPDIDLNPEKIYNDYLDRFLGVKYPDGMVIAYPKPEGC